MRLLAGTKQLQHIPLPGLLTAAGHPSAKAAAAVGKGAAARGMLDAGPVHIKFAQVCARCACFSIRMQDKQSLAVAVNLKKTPCIQLCPGCCCEEKAELASLTTNKQSLVQQVLDPHVLILLSDGSALLLRGDPAGRRLGLARAALPPLHDAVHAAPDEQVTAVSGRGGL